jgi:hypothetical protein
MIAVGTQLGNSDQGLENLDFVVDSLSEAYFSETASIKYRKEDQSKASSPLLVGQSPDQKNLNTIKEGEEDPLSRKPSTANAQTPEDIETHISLVAALENSGIDISLMNRSLELGYIYRDDANKRLAASFPSQLSFQPV